MLDVKQPEGRELFRACRISDVLVENSVPGTMEKLGFDYPTLEKLNPRLVYCTITGYGHSGPYRNRASMDMVVQAMSGIMAKTGFEDGPPTKVGVTVGDQIPGLYGALGVLAALRQRELDGRGQVVDVAMLDALVALLWDEPLDEFEDQGIPQRVGNTDPRGAPLAVYPAQDGWIAIVVSSEASGSAWRDHGPRGSAGALAGAQRALRAAQAGECRGREVDQRRARAADHGSAAPARRALRAGAGRMGRAPRSAGRAPRHARAAAPPRPARGLGLSGPRCPSSSRGPSAA